MLASHIESQIYNNFQFEPTFEQKKIIFSLSQFLTSTDFHSVFLLNGYAGTGKTTIIAALVKTLNSLNIKSELLAPTGRAAKVMSQYCNKASATIHRKIYRKKNSGDLFSKYSLNFNRSNDTIYIIDEASMISDAKSSEFGNGSLLEDLFEYIGSGNRNKIVLVGDVAQLPPVGYSYSPALDIQRLKSLCSPELYHLGEVVRQEKTSGILLNATRIRELIENQSEGEILEITQSDDVVRVSGGELIEHLEDSYGRYGKGGCAVITRSNKRANRFNQGIRGSILGYEEELESGDMMMVVKNNYFGEVLKDGMDFIANGDFVVLRRILKHEDRHGFRFALAELELPDYDEKRIERWILLEALHSDAPSLSKAQQEHLFLSVSEDYADESTKRKRMQKVKEDPFYNALQVKFAYAFTCHKSQGGQWEEVYIDTLLFGEEEFTIDFMRWLYTALTRSIHRVYFVNWDDKFFPEN